MKTLVKILMIISVAAYMDAVRSQTINWAGPEDGSDNFVTASLGYQFGFEYGLAFGHHFRTALFPSMIGIAYSSPTGTNVFDDFKIETGGQIKWVGLGHFQFSTKAYGVFRRYENEFVRLLNFGSNLAAVLGYYRSRWFVSGEVGFDKAIVTNFKHSEIYLEINPTAANGWYNPSTGGNLYYGIQAGVSMKRSDIGLRIGRILSEDLRSKPMIPYYFQLGYSRRF